MASPQPLEWYRPSDSNDYLVSTSRTLLSHTFINAAFADPSMYWASPLPLADLTTLLDASTTLGLYALPSSIPPASTTSSPSSPRTPSPTLSPAADPMPQVRQIGLARLVTDRVTTVYLTDVYVAPEHRGKGLGKWLIECCGEVIEGMPHLRRTLLMAGAGPREEPTGGPAVRFYEEVLGMEVLRQGEGVVVMMKRGPAGRV